MKKNILAFLTLTLVFSSFLYCKNILAFDITFSNPVGSDDATITGFFENIMSYMQSIIAYLALLLILIAGILYLFAGVNTKMVTVAKVCFVSALIGFAVAAAAPSFLKEIKDIVLRDGAMPTTLESALTLKEIIMNIANFILSIFGTLAIIGLIMSGIFFVSSAGNASQVQAAKNAMIYSIIGIAVTGSAMILIKTIAKLITD